MTAHFFPDQESFRGWLEKHHETETEVLVGFYRVGSGKPSMTWPESVDQALCFGWIDAVRKSIDKESYSIRFTRRKRNSVWSRINIAKVEKLIASGAMRPAGMAAFEARSEKRSEIYNHENEEIEFSPDLKELFVAHEEAWRFFIAQPPGYQKLSKHRVMTAKQDQTRRRRLETLIRACGQGIRL